MFRAVTIAAALASMTAFGPPPDTLEAQLAGLPGVGIAVITVDGERSDFKSYGVRFKGNSRFEIGSISKTFTAALFADMVQRGEVAPSDPIERFLPVGATAPAFGERHITLLDLATQSSGLPRLPTNFTPKDPARPYADYDEAKLLAFLASYRLARAPGAQFEYSNLGYGLLGYLLARRLKLDYATAIRTRVLEPLGMSHTTLETVGAPATQTVCGHDADGDPAPGWTFDALAGCGAVVSTPNDMLRYARANLDATAGNLNAALLAAQQPLRDADLARRIGYSWITQADGIVWHNGGTAGFRSFLGLDHSRGRAIVVLANAYLDSVDVIGLHALDPLVPPPLPPQPDAPVDRRALARLVGTYRFAADGSTCSITIDKRGLIATFAPATFRARLHARSATEFNLRLGGIVLRFNDVGSGTTLSIEQPGQPAQIATLTPPGPHT